MRTLTQAPRPREAKNLVARLRGDDTRIRKFAGLLRRYAAEEPRHAAASEAWTKASSVAEVALNLVRVDGDEPRTPFVKRTEALADAASADDSG